WPMIAATGVAFLGLLAQAFALVFAWPHAVAILLIGGLVYASWTAVAAVFRLPLAHAWAIPGLVVAVLAGHQLVLADSLSDLLQWRMLISGETGLILAGLSILFVGVADRMRAANVWRHGVMYAGAAALAMTAALVLVGREAAAEPARAAAVAAVAAAGCFLLCQRWRYPALRQIAFALIPLVTLALLHWQLGGRQEIWAAVLATEVLAYSLIA